MSANGFEEYITNSPSDIVQCSGCSGRLPSGEQYGHFQSCAKVQELAVVRKLVSQGQVRMAKEERMAERDHAKAERKAREAREREGRARERGE